MKKILFACALAPLFLTACGDDEDELPKVDPGDVAYTQCPDGKHPHAIDLGLPSGTKWACCNIGSKTETDYGQHFAWGDPQIKTRFSWPSYSHYEIIDFAPHVAYLGEDIQGSQNDVARNLWQHKWEMPSLDQFTELRSNCRIEWTKRDLGNGEVVRGILATGKNGASIFLPAGGYKESAGADDAMFDYHREAGAMGYYWLSNAYPEVNDYAQRVVISSSKRIDFSTYYRCIGHSIRPVRK